MKEKPTDIIASPLQLNKSVSVDSSSSTELIKRLLSYFFSLARMRRKSKCYFKKMKMLAISVLLLMHYKNGTLHIFT